MTAASQTLTGTRAPMRGNSLHGKYDGMTLTIAPGRDAMQSDASGDGGDVALCAEH